ncbi:MAG: hypothetical protein AAB425_07995, partial [Bdellovibrionota bacterium]
EAEPTYKSTGNRSACMLAGTLGTQTASSVMLVPGSTDGLLQVGHARIHAYTTSDCSGSSRIFVFKNGIGNPVSTSFGGTAALYSNQSGERHLYLGAD